jgi:hypothetical protein
LLRSIIDTIGILKRARYRVLRWSLVMIRWGWSLDGLLSLILKLVILLELLRGKGQDLIRQYLLMDRRRHLWNILIINLDSGICILKVLTMLLSEWRIMVVSLKEMVILRLRLAYKHRLVVHRVM